MIKYIENIKNCYFRDFLDSSNNEKSDAKKWMLHINEIADALIIDEFFENFISINCGI